VACDGVPAFELAIPGEVFGSPVLEGHYELLTIAGNRRQPRTNCGWLLQTDGGLELLEGVDTVVIAGWRDDLAPPAGRLCEALAAAEARGTRLVSLCTGAFALAAAGVLDGRRATTHWRHAAAFTHRFPAVDLDPSVLYVDDGDVLTSAGTVAGIDLCLHIVRTDLGSALANAVARRLVHAPHRSGGQAQYVEAPAPDERAHGEDELLAWIQAHLAEPLQLDDLARRAHLSGRQLARRFRARTGVTPHRWILQQRLLRAQELLEMTDLPVEGVAREAGFGSPANLRLHFTRSLGTAPQRYRQAFQRDPHRATSRPAAD
jgi:AraC family transcriptional activator FtrA